MDDSDAWFRRFFAFAAAYVVVAAVAGLAVLAGVAWTVFQLLQHFGVV